jgi:hypothetical protein
MGSNFNDFFMMLLRGPGRLKKSKSSRSQMLVNFMERRGLAVRHGRLPLGGSIR